MNKALSIFNVFWRTYYAIPANSFNTVYNCCLGVENIPYLIYKGIKYSTNPSSIAMYEEIKEIGTNKDKKVLLIDVREPEELRETGVIPGSINIPLGRIACALKDMSDEEFLKMYGREKPNLDYPIIFSCRSGRRSSEAQAVSQQLGYKNVRNYPGGWIDWEQKSK